MFPVHKHRVLHSAAWRLRSTRQHIRHYVERGYSDAIQALNTLQANHATVALVRQNPNAMHAVAMPEMHSWLERAGYHASNLNCLNAIHIAGTKGKGSTSAFISSILAQYVADPSTPAASASPNKIGLYTSPHLRFVRERIQINNSLISEPLFAKSFFEIWDRLNQAVQSKGPFPDGATKPAYFRFLTILALHVFLREGVDAAIIECGAGGEYDSTNVLAKPAVTGITSLGLDHTPMLGDTIESIAWHKAGIMKPGAKCFTVPQSKQAMEVLKKVAEKRRVEMAVLEAVHPEIETMKLGLSGEFQKMNASLAVLIAAEYLQLIGNPQFEGLPRPGFPLPKQFIRGLKSAYIGGRCETRKDALAPITWRIDGAHTIESIQAAAEWFASCFSEGSTNVPAGPRILLFNQQTREVEPLLTRLYDTLSQALNSGRPFTHAIFCTNKTYLASGYRPDLISLNNNQSDVETLEVQERLAAVWERLDKQSTGNKCEVKILVSVEEAIEECRRIARESGKPEAQAEAFVTGSMHLIGGVLEVLES